MDTLLSVRQVAYILKVHPLTIRRYINEKRLKAIRVGGNIRIAEKELQDFQRDVTSAPKPKNVYAKTKSFSAKVFTNEDPLLRLQGRAASLKLTKEQLYGK